MGQNVSPEETLTQIRQEKAAAGKRLCRYRQATEKIRGQNLALRHFLGFASLGDLERMLVEEGVHPQGLAMFKEALEKRGKPLPEFLSQVPVPGREQGSEDTAAPAPEKRGSRVKFKL